MSKTWFKDRDGTFFRNCGCVERDKRRARVRPWLWWRLGALDREWWDIFREGVTRTDKIDRFDRIAEPVPFRLAYPNHPGLWRLDDTDDRVA